MALAVCAAAADTLAADGLAADALDAVRKRGELIWGADGEGGGPYVFSDPADPRRVTGFEVDLADALARELGVKARFSQGPWDNLPAMLNTGAVDIVLNGYELTPARAGRMANTYPYYIYELVLLVRRDNRHLHDWADLAHKIDGRRPKVGVLLSSAADHYVLDHYADTVELVRYEETTAAMREVETGKLDATVADLPPVIFYRDRFAGLEQVGKPSGRGYYVIFLRPEDGRLRDALNAALVRLLHSGELRSIYERYGIWLPVEEELTKVVGRSDEELGIRATQEGGWAVIWNRGGLLLRAAWTTVQLACISMPLAIAIGLLVAVGRLYGPAPLRWLLVAYIEILRGTPLMLQLFFIFFLLPEIGLKIPAFYAAITGLAINYSACEAENYRAGLQAVPRGQMEAALALGMSPLLALRRIVIPQAVRIVIPPVTNDFIALFKDTSVCSVITVVELTKQYSIQRNDTGATLELAGLTALLYLLMSVPLAHLASRLERRLQRREKNA
jgi:polar amino acid transport system substrate-binding protein